MLTRNELIDKLGDQVYVGSVYRAPDRPIDAVLVKSSKTLKIPKMADCRKDHHAAANIPL
jgi:hypothetical protein